MASCEVGERQGEWQSTDDYFDMLAPYHDVIAQDGNGFEQGPLGAIVAHEADVRVVELTSLLEVVDDAPDVTIHLGDHAWDDAARDSAREHKNGGI